MPQWAGSLCDSKKGCCFQDPEKPPAPEFGIHGLWPQYAPCRPAAGDDGAAAAAFNILGSTGTVGKTKKKCWPENCDKKDKLDLLQIKDLLAALERDWATLSCKNGATNMDFWATSGRSTAPARPSTSTVDCPEPLLRNCADKIKFPAF